MAIATSSVNTNFLHYDMELAMKRQSIQATTMSPCNSDNGIENKWTTNHRIQFLKYEEVPIYLKYPFIVNGYRCELPYHLCWKSLFVWSNESINVWTHLGGCGILTFLTIYDNLILLPRYQASFADHAVITLSLFCFQFCLFASAGYHLFNCHSERTAKRWLALDLAGISIGLIGSYLPGIHYIFYCSLLWRNVYLFLVCLLFVGVIKYQTQPKFVSGGSFLHRILLYIGLLSYGIIPLVHWLMINGSITPLVQLFLPKVATLYALITLAFFFYMLKFPERFYPGYFDYVGASHQVWHIIVFSAFIYWRKAEHELLEFSVNTPCPA